MNRIQKIFLISLFLFIYSSLQAANLEGTYQAYGSNPGGGGSYQGTVKIKRTNQSYNVVWNVGAYYYGTGVVVGDVLSVAYTDQKKTWFGIVAYKIKNGGRNLEGLWTGSGGRNLGKENLVRK